MSRAYFSHTIRGQQGENASQAHQQDNIDKACQLAQKIRRRFPQVSLFVPHEIEVLNEMCFEGRISGDDLVEIECVMIENLLFDVVIVVGDYHSGSGVAMEIQTAHDSGVPIVFLDDVEEKSLEYLAQGLVGLDV
jgi:hypothetical protein